MPPPAVVLPAGVWVNHFTTPANPVSTAIPIPTCFKKSLRSILFCRIVLTCFCIILVHLFIFYFISIFGHKRFGVKRKMWKWAGYRGRNRQWCAGVEYVLGCGAWRAVRLAAGCALGVRVDGQVSAALAARL